MFGKNKIINFKKNKIINLEKNIRLYKECFWLTTFKARVVQQLPVDL